MGNNNSCQNLKHSAQKLGVDCFNDTDNSCFFAKCSAKEVLRKLESDSQSHPDDSDDSYDSEEPGQPDKFEAYTQENEKVYISYADMNKYCVDVIKSISKLDGIEIAYNKPVTFYPTTNDMLKKTNSTMALIPKRADRYLFTNYCTKDLFPTLSRDLSTFW